MLRPKLTELRSRIRTTLVAYGTSRLLLSLVGLAALSFGCDYLFTLPLAVRAVLLVVIAGSLVTIAYRNVLHSARVPISDDDLALYYERAYPEAHEVLVSAIQFERELKRKDYANSRSLSEMVIRRADKFAEKLDPKTILNTRAMFRSVAAAVIALGLGVTAAATEPTLTSIWLRRLALGDTAWPRKTHLEVSYPKAVVRGDDAAITVKARRGAPSFVTLSYTLAGGFASSIRLERDQDSYHFTFRQLLEPVAFRIRGGDHELADMRIDVTTPPRLEEARCRCAYPEYTRLGSTISLDGNVRALVGTQVEFSGTANTALSKAWLEIMGQIVPLTVSDKNMTGHFKVAASGEYAVRMVAPNGLDNREPARFRIDAQTDKPPTVRIVKPARDNHKVLKDSALPIEIFAEDDFGIKSLELRYVVGTGAEQVLPVALPATPWGEQQITATQALPKFAEGQEVAYWARATDYAGGEQVSGRYRLEIVTRDQLAEWIDQVGADVLARLTALIELEERAAADTEELVGQLAGRKPSDTESRRLFMTSILQEQVTTGADEIQNTLKLLIDDIKTFDLPQIKGVDQLEAAEGALRRVAKDKSPRAHAFLKSAVLDGAHTVQSDVLKELRDALENLKEFARFNHVLKALRAIIQKQAEVKSELQDKARKKEK